LAERFGGRGLRGVGVFRFFVFVAIGFSPAVTLIID
jgi:hypothetical protein